MPYSGQQHSLYLTPGHWHDRMRMIDLPPGPSTRPPPRPPAFALQGRSFSSRLSRLDPISFPSLLLGLTCSAAVPCHDTAVLRPLSFPLPRTSELPLAAAGELLPPCTPGKGYEAGPRHVLLSLESANRGPLLRPPLRGLSLPLRHVNPRSTHCSQAQPVLRSALTKGEQASR